MWWCPRCERTVKLGGHATSRTCGCNSNVKFMQLREEQRVARPHQPIRPVAEVRPEPDDTPDSPTPAPGSAPADVAAAPSVASAEVEPRDVLVTSVTDFLDAIVVPQPPEKETPGQEPVDSETAPPEGEGTGKKKRRRRRRGRKPRSGEKGTEANAAPPAETAASGNQQPQGAVVPPNAGEADAATSAESPNAKEPGKSRRRKRRRNRNRRKKKPTE